MFRKKVLLIVCLTLVGYGCAKKKVATAPPPSNPTPAAPQKPAAPVKTPVQTARATPTPPPPMTRETAPAKSSFGELISSKLRDVYFEYDRSAIREGDGSTLAQDATVLKQIFRDFPRGKVMVEGECDERGSSEYNLALGDKRARAAKEYLSHLGVPADRLDVISYGKEHPVCNEENESCWQKNRRAHFAAE
jgi:peptidoglycan-associated lipoprotein